MPGRKIEPALSQLLQRRAELLEILVSERHRTETPTVEYGPHNPFIVQIAPCDSCGAPAAHRKVSAAKSRTRWVMICSGCGKCSGEGQRERWMAELMWNGTNLGTQRYQDLPMFALAELDHHAARERIAGIRENLVYRVSLCSVDRAIAMLDRQHPRPGTQYQRRLDAYLKWAVLASKLVKNARS